MTEVKNYIAIISVVLVASCSSYSPTPYSRGNTGYRYVTQDSPDRAFRAVQRYLDSRVVSLVFTNGRYVKPPRGIHIHPRSQDAVHLSDVSISVERDRFTVSGESRFRSITRGLLPKSGPRTFSVLWT